MPNEAQYKELDRLILEGLNKIKNLKIDELLREKDLGHLGGFKEAEKFIKNIIELYSKIEPGDLNGLPYNKIAGFSNHLHDALNILESIKTFDPLSENSSTKRTRIISSLEKNYDAYYDNTAPVLIAKVAKNQESDKNPSNYTKIIEETIDKYEKDKIRSAEIIQEMESALQSVRDSSAQSGVTKYAKLFLNESSLHEVEASFWLGWVFKIIGSIIVLSVIMLFFLDYFNTSTATVVQFSVAKIIVLTALFYALSVCMKNFRAHKHNALVNKHRHNALTTFETFTNAADGDNQTKNTVLIEATRTIFSNQQTGYSLSAGEPESTNKIVEIIKNVSNGSQS